MERWNDEVISAVANKMLVIWGAVKTDDEFGVNVFRMFMQSKKAAELMNKFAEAKKNEIRFGKAIEAFQPLEKIVNSKLGGDA